MSVLEKAVQVIDLLGRSSGPVRLGAIAESMSVPKSSAHRLLSELTAHGLVRRAGDGEYALGYRLVKWGHLADRSVGIRHVAEPVMTRLRDQVRESVHLYVVEEDHRVCVLSVEGPHTLRPVAVLGRPLPLGFGAAGKLLYAYSDEAVQRRVAASLPEHRGKELPDAAEQATIRERAFATSVSEMEDGLSAVATPIATPGGVSGALAIASTSTRLPESRYEEIRELLTEAAREIAAALGG
ncbi:IclR family transcriptional regulator [Nocardioides sp. zg-DK7169]|uniref:IclR family transcriptional regulator n=1 Tax=Nocardioides sp. zg-DK7169 TaxID=2736600 RepID=UPI001554FEF9|nr:IclR family transcriptional regulator [Nocardioides sp. zg-DK7169]NPC97037.1 IclR family transcriptional regulator [Nocardioides sp. zg-DK7169]